jgi:hypothetical protein
MQPFLIFKLIVLLSIANGTPVLVKKVWGNRFSWPIDGGCKFVDGRPVFGPSKTIRGALASIALTTAGAPLLGFDLPIGALVGSTAMAGDLFSSFVKRRLNFLPSSRATGLDQIPESLFPLLACRGLLSLTAVDILIGGTAFFIGEIFLSRILYRLQLRDRPY